MCVYVYNTHTHTHTQLKENESHLLYGQGYRTQMNYLRKVNLFLTSTSNTPLLNMQILLGHTLEGIIFFRLQKKRTKLHNLQIEMEMQFL